MTNIIQDVIFIVNMKRATLASLGILIILTIAYFKDALNKQFMHEIKMMYLCLILMLITSSAYWIYESIQRKKVQTKQGE